MSEDEIHWISFITLAIELVTYIVCKRGALLTKRLFILTVLQGLWSVCKT